MSWETIAWPMAGITLWVAAFFRDPVRTTPKGEGLIIAPADGMVTMIANVPPPRELIGEDALSDEPDHPRLDLHERVRRPHQPHADRGRRSSASSISPASSSTPISTRRARTMSASISWSRAMTAPAIGFTQIAGLVARRIVPWVKPGDFVAAGQRVGLIRFGSRVDVYLPAGTAPQVLLGQRTIAGETIIARVGVTEPVEGVSQ